MIRTRAVATFVTLGLLFSAASASAQTVCPTADEGQTCSGGTCIPAMCTFATSGGAMSSSMPCGLCVSIGPEQCLASDEGKACGDGGTCQASSVGGGGGGGVGGGGGGQVEAGTLTGFSYGIGSCVVPHEGGAGGDGGELGAGDAGAEGNGEDGGTAGGQGGDASVHTKDAGVTSKNDAGSRDGGEGDDSQGDGSSGGCSMTEESPIAPWPLGLVGAALVLSRRRRRN